MRRLAGVLTIALAACGGGGGDGAGPAWPKSAGWEAPEDWKEDGGESIEPQLAAEAAAIEASEEPEPEPSADVEVTVEVDPAPVPDEPPETPDTPEIDFAEDEAIIIEGELDETEPEPETSPAPRAP